MIAGPKTVVSNDLQTKHPEPLTLGSPSAAGGMSVQPFEEVGGHPTSRWNIRLSKILVC